MSISSNYDNTSRTAHYPNDILSEKNQFRNIQLIIKNQESINGGVAQLQSQIEQAYGDLKNAVDNLGTGTENPAGSDYQKRLKERAPTISGLRTIYGIGLPLPNELIDSQTHNWESTEGLVSSVASGLTNAKVGGVGVNAALGEIASSAGFRKPLIDPGYFQDYKGSTPRSFSFSWDLIPNNAEEVDSIMHIIYNLKKYTAPTSTINGVSLLSPYIFDIQIGNDRISKLMNMNNVVCTNMNVNYSVDGGLQFLPDGMPKHIKLDMSFAERSLVTSNFF